MSTQPQIDDDVLDALTDDEPTISEALELWATMENPREMLDAGRRDRGGSR